MKEEEFLEKVEERINFEEGFIVKLYYSIDEGGNVILDEEGMKDEFEKKLGWIREILEEKDELQELVGEKIKRIKNGKHKR